MLNRFLTYLKYGNSFCGIEHSYNDQYNDIIYISLLKQNKNELELENNFSFKSVEEIYKKIKKNQHAYLILNNSQVLSKKINSEKKTIQKLVYKAFPNVNLDEFYCEILSQSNEHFISICRKDYIDKLINDYELNNIHIIGFSLGSNSISVLENLLNCDQVKTSNSIVYLNNTNVEDISKEFSKPDIYNLNGIDILSKYILSFSGALYSVVKTQITNSNYDNKIEIINENYLQKQFFNQFLKIGGTTILFALLINFFVFNYYFDEVNKLNQVTEINKSTKEKIVSLKGIVLKKQKMVEDLLKSRSSKSSFFLNEIVKELPKSILLSEINYQPLEKRIKKNRFIEVNNQVIILSGTTNENSNFSNWIYLLEKKSWINSISIIEFGNSTKQTSEFTIKINLNYE